MRRFLLLVLLTVGCNRLPERETQWYHENGKLKVLSTIAMIHDVVQEIGGEEVDAISLIQGELNPHCYELVKGDDEKLARADLIFYNGLGLEHGLSLRQNLEGNPKAIAVTHSLLKNHPSLILKVDGQSDPHIWMDARLWAHIIDPIVIALCEKDPKHAFLYHERGERLGGALALADEKAYAKLQAIPEEKRYIVTSHDALNYFTRRYLATPNEKNWRDRCAAPEGLAPDAQMSVTDVMDIVSHIEKFGISLLFPESNVNRDSLRKIAHVGKKKGLTIELSQKFLYGDAMGKASSYLEMFAHNVEVIEQGLTRISHKS